VGLVLVLTIAGSMLARGLAERDARRDSDRQVELAAALIGSRIGEATSLATSLRRFISTEGAAGVTNDQFAQIALRWLSPADVPAAAWVEEIAAGERADYERRLGHVIVTPEQLRTPEPPRSSYLPATLVSGYPPIDVPGIDLGREPGMLEAIARAESPGGVAATPFAVRRDGTSGLFLVAQSANVIYGQLRPGALVVFVSEQALRAAARNPAGLEFVPAGSPADGAGADTVREDFAVPGGRLAVVMPRASVTGAGAVLPWLILAAGLVLAALAGALGVNATRRAKAQADLDRIFNLSPDLIAVADFNGYFTRLNPASERILGYSEHELLARPYLDFVHPEDRLRTAAEETAISGGKTTLSFENRYVRKDGSERVLEWTATPVVDEGVMYAVARDVTERRKAEEEVERLAEEQAALRRVATLVARGEQPAQIFAAVSDEVGRLFGSDLASVGRFDNDLQAIIVVGLANVDAVPIGSRWELDDSMSAAAVYRSGRSARVDGVDWSEVDVSIAQVGRQLAVVSSVSSPIIVEGRLWGAITVVAKEPLPRDAENRLEKFTELVATAIANVESRGAVERLADEQAALRRVATLVAEGVPPTELFSGVTTEVAHVFSDVDPVLVASVIRFDPGPESVLVGASRAYEQEPLGARWAPKDLYVSTRVLRTGSSARVDEADLDSAGGPDADVLRLRGFLYQVGSPIVVEGSIWGAMCLNSRQELPADTDRRLESFTELVATAIANAEGRSELAASRRRIVAASDDARRRIERDLHDGIQQELVSLSLEVGEMEAGLPAGHVLKEPLANVSASVGSTLDSLVEVARGIHPSILSQGGLAMALHSLARRSAVPVEVDARIDAPVPDAIEVAAYYVASEALTNVAKHARASVAHVDVTMDDGTLMLAVRDDGVGEAALGQGSGLVGLQDRVEALGGTITIDSSAGKGTRVVVRLPVGTEPDQEIENFLDPRQELEPPTSLA
jgi:PAS domain S-box-containing protein